jgi:hypothetical protein
MKCKVRSFSNGLSLDKPFVTLLVFFITYLFGNCSLFGVKIRNFRLNRSNIILVLTLIWGCTSTQNISLNKLDPALKEQVIKYQNSNSKELIRFVGETKVTLDSTIENSIKSSGIQINSISKSIFTGKGNVEAVLKLIDSDYIKALEANKPLSPDEKK